MGRWQLLLEWPLEHLAHMDSNAEQGSLLMTSARGGQRHTMRFVPCLRGRSATYGERQDCQWTWIDAAVYAPQILRTSLCWTSDTDRRRIVLGKHHGARSATVRISYAVGWTVDVWKRVKIFGPITPLGGIIMMAG